MIPQIGYSFDGAQAALTRHAYAAASGEQPPAKMPREVCMKCGRLRPVASTIPIRCAGQGIEFAPLCPSCSREVSR